MVEGEMKYYVAVDIGCIECGEGTSVLGIFTNKDVADETTKEHAARQKENWHGQHHFAVFEIGEIDKIYTVDY